MERRRINVRGIIYQDGKILAVKHKNKEGRESAYWAIPGGGLDPFEPLQKGVEREILEELGVRAKVGGLLFIQQFRSDRFGRDEELEFFFLVENTEDFHTINLKNTTHGAVELARVEFINPQNEVILPDILQTVSIEGLMNSPVPKIISYLDDSEDSVVITA